MAAFPRYFTENDLGSKSGFVAMGIGGSANPMRLRPDFNALGDLACGDIHDVNVVPGGVGDIKFLFALGGAGREKEAEG